MGRPRAKIDPEQVRKLAAIDCTIAEIAAVVGCSRDTLERRCRAELNDGREQGKASLRRKQFDTGLRELTEEGAAQVFFAQTEAGPTPIVGAVGMLQFDVMQYRLEHEYGARIALDRLPFSHARWVVGDNFEPRAFDWEGNRQTVQDRDGLPLVLFRDDWALQHAQEKHPELQFLSAAPQLKAT